jgi:glycosyltransferase involved in cell wall biosynthesis
MSQPPLISIITPCLNRQDTITDCIESVLRQNFNDYEHIVIDGGSTDKTLEILQQYEHLKITSEPDQNLYDAINKGLQKAQGQFIFLANSDDIVLPGCLRIIGDAIKHNPAVEIVCGGACVFKSSSKNNRELLQEHNSPPSKNMSVRDLAMGVPIINARCIKKSLFTKLGCFDITYPIAADRLWLIKASLTEINYISVDSIFYAYRASNDSLTIHQDRSAWMKVGMEHLRIVDELESRIPFKEKRTLRHFHAKSIVMVALACLSKCHPLQAIKYLLQGMKYNLFLPVTMLKLAYQTARKRRLSPPISGECQKLMDQI